MNKFNEAKVKCLQEAVSEAERFISRANEAIEDLSKAGRYSYQSMYVSSAKRASMDLTRKLVNVRTPRTDK